MRHLLIVIGLQLAISTPTQAQFGDILKKLGLAKNDELSDDTVISGLKEALQVGTSNTVRSTGHVDGYFANQAIKILLPSRIQKMDKALRFAGYGDELDSFVLSMNRAAEKAAPRAKSIFWDAIKAMTFSDARGILAGDETAATDYFREKTSGRLTDAFLPVIQDSMNEVGATRQYQSLVRDIESIPFMQAGSLDLDQYVVTKALDGLFYVLGQEETRIRTDPAARVTDLLKTVFGRRSG